MGNLKYRLPGKFLFSPGGVFTAQSKKNKIPFRETPMHKRVSNLSKLNFHL
jgi:hypothetical protein